MRAWWWVVIALAGCGRIGFDRGELDTVTARGALTMSGRFACTIRAERVWCWGDGSNAQLGNASRALAATPVLVSGVVGVTAVSAGGHHACAVTADGEVWCWGNNDSLQLGFDREPVDPNVVAVLGYPEPRPVPGLPGPVAEVAASGESTCARLVDGTVWCWGGNGYGQLGRGTVSWDDVPAAVPGLRNVVAIAAARDAACAVVEGGSTWCWGANKYKLIDDTGTDHLVPAKIAGVTGATAVTVGGNHACVLVGGRIGCWGGNDYGALGDGTETHRTTLAFLILEDVVAAAAGEHHTCAVRGRGDVVCWGNNSKGALGDGTTHHRLAPSSVVERMTDVVRVVAGGDSSCALRVDGSVACWGGGARGQLGDGRSAQPRPTPIDAYGAMIGAGRVHTCTSDGASVRCWGSNHDGQLGVITDPDAERQATPVTTMQPWPGSVMSLAVGGYHTCVAVTDGTAWCWGYNGYGQLGDGTEDERAMPAIVPGLAGVVAIKAGYKHTCALLADTSVWCWGYNESGQLGNGTTTDASSPTLALTGASELDLGEAHGCALSGSQVSCWGSAYYGQIGNGGTVDMLVPTQVGGASMGLAVGGDSTCSARVSGGVECWGYNDYNLLDGGGNSQEESPVTSGQPLLYELGYVTSCAMGGCWGENEDGQLGDGSFESRSSTAGLVDLASPPTSFALGGHHSCALVGGRAYCWGDSPNGELGIGMITISPSPVEVRL